MRNRDVSSISTDAQGKIFPWLVVILLINNEGKIALKETNTGKHALLKEFGGSIEGLEFSYKETVERTLDKHNISAKKIVIGEVLDIKDSYRADLRNYKKIFVRVDVSEARICPDKVNPAGWYFPSDIFFLTMSDEDKKLIAREFGLDEKRFAKAAAV